MQKAYVGEVAEEQQEYSSQVTLGFVPDPPHARIWKEGGVAEEHCRTFDAIHITAGHSGEYKNFGVEERLGQVVVFCEYHPRCKG
jgi:hypothetical protein